tara:strand:- start:78 stop:401 length:324 start_codon:yes stop_codon:yes gene_type:complete
MDINSEQILGESLKIHLLYKEALAKSGTLNMKALQEEVKTLYPYTSEKLPSVVTIALGESYDYSRLKFMLDMNTKVKNNEVTEKEGSIQVGQVLVDDIVKPSLKEKQ